MASGSPSKADQFRSSMVKGNIADSMFVAGLEDDEDNDAAVNDGEDWTCDNCSKIVPGKKSRCKCGSILSFIIHTHHKTYTLYSFLGGNCHRWRGGKRRGGWKLGKPMGRDEDSDDGIDRTQDWTCCGEILPAEKTRCGKVSKYNVVPVLLLSSITLILTIRLCSLYPVHLSAMVGEAGSELQPRKWIGIVPSVE